MLSNESCLQASLGVQSGGHESSIDSSGSLHSFPGTPTGSSSAMRASTTVVLGVPLTLHGLAGSGMAAHMGANAPPLGSQGSAFGSISNLTALPNSSLSGMLFGDAVTS